MCRTTVLLRTKTTACGGGGTLDAVWQTGGPNKKAGSDQKSDVSFLESPAFPQEKSLFGPTQRLTPQLEQIFVSGWLLRLVVVSQTPHVSRTFCTSFDIKTTMQLVREGIYPFLSLTLRHSKLERCTFLEGVWCVVQRRLLPF